MLYPRYRNMSCTPTITQHKSNYVLCDQVKEIVKWYDVGKQNGFERSIRIASQNDDFLTQCTGQHQSPGKNKRVQEGSIYSLWARHLPPGPWVLLVIEFLKTTGSPSSSAWRLSLEPNQYLVSTWPNQALRLQKVDPIDFLHNGQDQSHRHHCISDYPCPPNSLSTGNSN